MTTASTFDPFSVPRITERLGATRQYKLPNNDPFWAILVFIIAFAFTVAIMSQHHSDSAQISAAVK